MTKADLALLSGSAGVSAAAFTIEPLLAEPFVALALPLAYCGMAVLHTDSLRAVWCGAIAGATLDLLHGTPLGLHAGALSAASFLSSRLLRLAAVRHGAMRLGVLGIASILFFPVFFLLEALGGVERTWTSGAAAGFLLVNLLCLYSCGIIRVAAIRASA